MMVDSSSQALVEELNTKRRRIRLWPFITALTVGAYVLIANKQLPSWAGLTVLIAGGLLTAAAYYWDQLRKTTVMLYDIESEFSGVVEQLHAAFEGVRSCRATWHLQAQGKVTDRKYHAGASHLVTRSSIALGLKNPPFVKTNVATPSIPVGRQTLYFFPDKVLVFEANGVGAVSYENLRIDISTTNFIEDGAVPKDSEIVSTTWKFVNKKGGPDKRFKNNRKLPVVRYEEVQFTSSTGLLERIQISCVGRTQALAQAINSIGRAKGEHL
ncbi:TPA: nucleotide-binding protein [Pseudomonas aeruginosa]|nr:nucleotide-binding protein [Pseudomonas aeruginosa]HBP6505005.1 nucleotide-binding protein [Pseudomonas aeruginosa]